MTHLHVTNVNKQKQTNKSKSHLIFVFNFSSRASNNKLNRYKMQGMGNSSMMVLMNHQVVSFLFILIQLDDSFGILSNRWRY